MELHKNPEDASSSPVYIAACSMWSILSCSLNNFQVKDIHMMKDHCVRWVVVNMKFTSRAEYQLQGVCHIHSFFQDAADWKHEMVLEQESSSESASVSGFSKHGILCLTRPVAMVNILVILSTYKLDLMDWPWSVIALQPVEMDNIATRLVLNTVFNWLWYW